MTSIQQLIQKLNGVIFGGYVRDKIIHDFYALQYYTKCSAEYKNEKYNYNKYNDPNFLPETKDRMLLPYDIDCYMNPHHIEHFKNMLRNSLLEFVEEKAENYEHTKLYISFKLNPIIESNIEILKKIVIKVDIIHTQTPAHLPINKLLDFECNSLILTPDNEYKLCKFLSILCKDPMTKIDKFNEIYNNILARKTKILSPQIADYRIQHMLNKNWIISSDNITLTKSINYKATDKTDTTVCYICLENISSSGGHFNCCKRFIHLDCIEHIVTSNYGKCPLCRSEKIINACDFKLVTIN